LQSCVKHATLNLSSEQADEGAWHTIQNLKKKKNGRTPKKLKVKPLSEEFIGEHDDEDDGMAPNDASTKTPEVKDINGYTVDEIIRMYMDEMDKATANLALNPDQVKRKERDAMSIVDQVQDLRQRPLAHKTYARNLILLHNAAIVHINQLTSVPMKNKRRKPIIAAMAKEHTRDRHVATRITKAIEVDVDAALDPVSALAAEANEDIRQRVNKPVPGSDEDILSAMVDIPKEQKPDPTKDLFENARNSAAFSPQYIVEACIEAHIRDMNDKVIPGTSFALRWWQVIGTKWVTDLATNIVTMWIKGGIVADHIGLGKKFIAGGTIAKVRLPYRGC
jgi:hypothetical protein